MRALIESPAARQLLRFVIAGFGVTICTVLVYLLYAMVLHAAPLGANLVSHMTGVVLGYAVHSRFSFRAEQAHGDAAVVRFVAVSGVPLALNSLWVWLATGLLHGPAWLPVPAMLFVTPLASFALNRYWVFARAS